MCDAIWGGSAASATASVEIRVKRRFNADSPPGSSAPPLPADPAPLFTGRPTAGLSPTIVYPNDQVLLPPNLGRLEVHFVPQGGSTLYAIVIESPRATATVYTRCQELNGGCIFLPTDAVWKLIAETNRGLPAGVKVTVQATRENGGEVGVSQPLTVAFSQDDIEGGIYYWSTTRRAIMRFDFASATQVTAVKFADGASLTTGQPQSASCVGCHALSRDGQKMTIEAEGQWDGRVALLDVATNTLKTPFPAPAKAIFSSWNPDGSEYVGVHHEEETNLRIIDGNTGQPKLVIANTGTPANPANHPDWSYDGSTIAFTRVGIRNSLQQFGKGSLAFVRKEGTGWSAPVTLAPAVSGKNRFYPAIAPDNSFLIFNEST